MAMFIDHPDSGPYSGYPRSRPWRPLTKDHVMSLYKRIAELEAELAAANRRIYWLRRLKMPDSDALAKANREWSELLGDAEIRAEKAEAEVERLRHLGGAPPGVSPSPPEWWNASRCDWCGADLSNGASYNLVCNSHRKGRDDG